VAFLEMKMLQQWLNVTVNLRWSLQKGFLPLPKSVTPKNIKANLDIFDFDLSEEDMAVLDKIQGIKTQDNPDTVNF